MQGSLFSDINVLSTFVKIDCILSISGTSHCIKECQSQLPASHMVSSNDKTVICGNDGLIYNNHCQTCIGKYIDQNLKIVSKHHCKGMYLFTTLVSLRMKK